MQIPEESVSEFTRRTVATVDTTFRKDNIARLIVFESIANPAKLHYDQICQIVNSYQERSDERHLRECIRRYKIANQNLWLFVFKWELKKLGLIQDFRTMTGPKNFYHDPNGRKYQEMGQAMNGRNYFQEGNRRLKLDLLYEPYYSEIWGKLSAVSRLIFSFSTMDFCWHWLLFPLRIHLIEMKPRTKAGKTLLLFFARPPSISWKKSSFSPPCSRQYSIRR